MKINLSVRLKNPTFWLTFLPTAAAFIYSVCEIAGFVPAVSKENVISAAAAVISALASLGILVDPTTAGVSDSIEALGYTSPKVSVRL